MYILGFVRNLQSSSRYLFPYALRHGLTQSCSECLLADGVQARLTEDFSFLVLRVYTSIFFFYIYKYRSKCIKALTASALGYVLIFFKFSRHRYCTTVVLTRTSGKTTRKLRSRALYNRLRNATALKFLYHNTQRKQVYRVRFLHVIFCILLQSLSQCRLIKIPNPVSSNAVSG